MPQVADGPKGLNEILESTYQYCISSGGSEQYCSQVAWTAAKQKYKKDKNGKWIKKSLFEDILKLNNENKGVI